MIHHNKRRKGKMIQIEYFDGKDWIPAGDPWHSEHIAWISLGGDDYNYRTVDTETGKVLTDKSKKED